MPPSTQEVIMTTQEVIMTTDEIQYDMSKVGSSLMEDYIGSSLMED